jgi:3-dehydroquinate synthase
MRDSQTAQDQGVIGGREHLEQRVNVQFRYTVSFTQAVFAPGNSLLVDTLSPTPLASPARVFAVVDAGLLAAQPSLTAQLQGYFAAHGKRLELVAAPWSMPGGEASKNDDQVIGRLLEQLFARGLDRHSYLLAIGGGAMLDAAGYAAALFHRGMRLVRLPTTVLAQDDAGVGVKNGVNAFGVKNALGTFAPPFAVINDSDFLRTLSPRDRIAGLAEAVKVALIRDAPFFRFLVERAHALRSGAEAETRAAIQRCAELHLEHIRAAGDAFESGSARPLDFGHWAAHKLELLTDHTLRHGEAVGLGMLVDIRYSRLCGLLDERAAHEASTLIAALGLPTSDAALARREPNGELSVMRGLADFREHLGGQLTVTMLTDIGSGREVHDIDRALMERAIGDVHAGQRS